MRYFFFFLCWFALIPAYAGGDESVQGQQPVTQNVLLCPPIAALKKNPDTQTWYTSGGWKSFDISFVDKVTQFSGAQWKGANLGQIFCVYRGDLATEFPILLAYNVLAFTPKGGQWSDDLGGYLNCEAPNREDCPFIVRIKQESADIYKQAEELKTNTPKSTRSGF